jgi:hypothetical protein
MAPTSNNLKEEIVFNILKESNECVISDSNVDSDNHEDDIAAADASVDKDNCQLEEEGLGKSVYNSAFIWKAT